MKTHKDLDIWKRGIELVKKIYVTTKAFPREELYGLTSQMRRAAVSFPSNIAEGAARASQREFIQYLYISLGTLSELETQIIISEDLNCPVPNTMISEIEILRKMTLNLIKYLKTKVSK